MDPELVSKAVFLLGILIVGFVLLAVIPIPGFPTDGKLEFTSLNLEKEDVALGEKVAIDIAASGGNGVKEITVEGGGIMERIDCGMGAECSKKIELIFRQVGNYSLKVKAVDSGGTSIVETVHVRVSGSGKKCSDQTLFGQCSAQRPLICINGELLSDCESCGCPLEGICEGGVCKSVAVDAKIARFDSLKKRVLDDEEIGFVLQVKPAGNLEIQQGAPYKLRVELEGADRNFMLEYDIVLEQSLSCCRGEYAVQGIIPSGELSVGDYSATAVLLDPRERDGNKAVFDSRVVGEFVSVFERDDVPPSKPQALNFTKTEDGIRLSWSANSEADLAGYNIYKSTDVGELYILYSLSETVSSEETSLDLTISGKGRFHFTITAFDLSGNESEYGPGLLVELDGV
ncbi:MAG: hypothetical protein ABID38_05135 [Candidatus Diapherotrites archaeon]